MAAAAAAIVVLAIIGAKAGAHAPPHEPAAAASAPHTPGETAPLLAAAFLPALPSIPIIADGGNGEPPVAPADAPPQNENAPPPGGGLLPDGRVVLNAASETELTTLPGIGPSRARAILALRQQLKKFRAVEDLLRIKGIGRKMLRRLRPNVVLDRPSDHAHAPPAPALTSTAVSATAPPLAEDSDRANP